MNSNRNQAAETQNLLPGEQITKGVYLCPDGKYRWIYEFDMRRNPTILISVMRVIILAFAIVTGAMILLHLIEGFGDLRDYWNFYKWFLLLLGILLLLGLIAYLILAASFGWKYVIFFTMDETMVEHRPLRQQADKAKALSWLTVLAGFAAGNATTVGAGLIGASRNVSVSDLQAVRRVKAVRRRHVIYVNQLLGHNQVYAENEDFDFVKEYIAAHCPKAKISG